MDGSSHNWSGAIPDGTIIAGRGKPQRSHVEESNHRWRGARIDEGEQSQVSRTRQQSQVEGSDHN